VTIRRYTDETDGGVATAERPRVSENVSDEATVRRQESGGGSLMRGLVRAMLVLPLAYALVVVQMFLGLRLAFQIAGANPNNDVVDAAYEVGDPLAEPFQGIIANRTVDSGVLEQVNPGLFEPANAIAMAVYLTIGALVIGLILALTRSSSGGRTAGVVTTRSSERAAYEH